MGCYLFTSRFEFLLCLVGSECSNFINPIELVIDPFESYSILRLPNGEPVAFVEFTEYVAMDLKSCYPQQFRYRTMEEFEMASIWGYLLDTLDLDVAKQSIT